MGASVFLNWPLILNWPIKRNEEKNLNKLTSTPHTLKLQHPKLRKGLHARQGWDERGKNHDSRQGDL